MINWINTSDSLPGLDKSVLLWCRVGHALDYNIGVLHNMNGNGGYMEYKSGTGRVFRVPNRDYPENLRWHTNGCWLKLDEVEYWSELNEP